MPTLTVFTPTYNSEKTLPRVYDSLRRQTVLDFTWLIIDDGSTDGSAALIGAWRAEAPFPIEYSYQKNAGKHNAHNRAVSLASTPLFLILDADDELVPDAVARISGEWNRLTAADRRSIAGIWTLCVMPDGTPCGQPFPRDSLDTTLQALRYRHQCEGERLPCFSTEVLRAHPFPSTPPGACAYIPEAYVWTAITRRYSLRFLNIVCRIYHPGNGLSALARKEYRVSRAVVYGYAQPLTNDFEWFWHRPAFFFLCAAQTVRYGLYAGVLAEIARRLSWKASGLLLLVFPLGLALLIRDRVNGRIAGQLHEASTDAM